MLIGLITIIIMGYRTPEMFQIISVHIQTMKAIMIGCPLTIRSLARKTKTHIQDLEKEMDVLRYF